MPRLTRIHVNRHHIALNKKDGLNRPVFTVKDYKSNRRGDNVIIYGRSEMRYSPDDPLACGATAWMETSAVVDVYHERRRVP